MTEKKKEQKKVLKGMWVSHVTSVGVLAHGSVSFKPLFQARQATGELIDMFASAESSQECQIAEILQFSCEIQARRHGLQQIHCFPFPRLFML
jgi:hypothetical protein